MSNPEKQVYDDVHPEGIADECDEHCDHCCEPFAVSVDKMIERMYPDES